MRGQVDQAIVLQLAHTDQLVEPLFAGVDAQGQVNLTADGYGLFEKERRIGVVERGKDQSTNIADIGASIEAANQATLAGSAFEKLRLEKVSGQ